MKKIILSLFILSSFHHVSAQDTLTFMYYNILNYSSTVPPPTRLLSGIVHSINPDIFVTDEIATEASASQILSDVLNIDAQRHYNRAAFIDGPDKDNMLFYNADKISLYSQDTIQTDLRLINEYRCYYNDPEYISQHDTVFFYVYAAHLKASTGYEQDRYREVLRFKSHLNEVAGRENIFFGGDFNFYTSTEPAFVELTTPGEYQFFDPLDSIGNWHDSQSLPGTHTQSTRYRAFGGGASGGLDDRFDFIMTTQDILLGAHELRYIPGTYQAYGNDGQHLNDSLTNPPLNPFIPDSVTYQLYYMSDHLPVILKTYLNFDAAVPGHGKISGYKLQVYPNPAEEIVHYILPTGQKNAVVTLYDCTGRIITMMHPDETAGKEQEIQISKSLQNGIYFVKLSTDEGIYTGRFILNRTE
jgi:hypothetical protein